MKTGLRTRVAVGFALISIAVAAVVSIPTFLITQFYLLNQRERVAVTRAVLNVGEFVKGLESGKTPLQAMERIPIVGVSRAFALVDGVWVTNGGPVTPENTPPALVQQAPSKGATQRFAVDGELYLGVAVGLRNGSYVEVFALSELTNSLATIRAVLAGTTVAAAIAGALLGFLAAGRLLTPLQRIATKARRIGGGDLHVRFAPTSDRDLEPIVTAFNEMIDAVQAQVQRERRFSANVSHELRSPLTAVVGTSELLAAHTASLPEREAALVRVLDEQVGRLSRMLLDLLEIAKITGGQEVVVQEPVDLRALCEQVLTERGSGAAISGEAVVMSDGRRIERILRNVIDNACVHAAGVSAIGIEVRLVSDVTDPYAGTVPHRRIAVVSIDDNGPGIPEAMRERLFEPFMRGDAASATPGAGLGLAIAGEQATVIGGRIEILDAPTGGSRFRITLPVGSEV